MLMATLALAQADEFHQFEMVASDGKARPYVVYEPDAKGKRPLLVYLHGAISSENLKKDPMATAQKSSIINLARAGGYYVLFPYGQKGATWFDDVGVSMVLDEIAQTKAQFDIDKHKVFVSGFSDGGSGTLYLATTKADEFAGFIALNGSLGVAAHLGSSPVFLQNLNHKPLYVVNTISDMLYPSAMITPTIEMLQKHQSQVKFVSMAGNHDMSYLPQIQNELLSFIDKHKDDVRFEISLETADDFATRFDWLKVESLALDKPAKSWHLPYRLKMFNDKASFGIVPDNNHQGEGIKVAGFSKNNQTAQNMGVNIGDVVVKMEDVAINHPYASLMYLSTKKAGQNTSLTVLRDGKPLILQGKFSDGYDYEVFENKKPSGKIQAMFEPDKLTVQTSRIERFSIDFDQLPINKRQNFTIQINNKIQTIQAVGEQTFLVE